MLDLEVLADQIIDDFPEVGLTYTILEAVKMAGITSLTVFQLNELDAIIFHKLLEYEADYVEQQENRNLAYNPNSNLYI